MDSAVPTEQKKSKRPGLKRIYVTGSVLFSLVSGALVWGYFITREHSSLPHAQIDNLQSLPPVAFPITVHVVILLGNNSKSPTWMKSLSQDIELKWLRSNDCPLILHISVASSDSCDLNKSLSSDAGPRVEYDSWQHLSCSILKFPVLSSQQDASGADKWLEGRLKATANTRETLQRHYTIVAFQSPSLLVPGGTTATIGQYRQAWIESADFEADGTGGKLTNVICTIVKRYFVDGGLVDAKLPGRLPMRAVLSFSLLTAHPSDSLYIWDFEAFAEKYLEAMVGSLTDVVNLTAESQVLYVPPTLAEASWNPSLRQYELDADHWPEFRNADEWHLDSSPAVSAETKILHFIVYAPSQSQSPLRLRLQNGQLSPTNSFILPGWGGVSILNPGPCAGPPESARCSPWSDREELQYAATFLAQLRLLLGLSPGPVSDPTLGITGIPSPESGFTAWEVDALTRLIALHNCQEASSALLSLSRIVLSLSSVVVGDAAVHKARASLEYLKFVQLAEGWEDGQLVINARLARIMAEEALFDSSMAPATFYPLEHHLALYTPMFLPLIMHIVVSFIKELTLYRQRWKKWKDAL